ncbi:aromatic-ring hydroxylase C-terminal domain-containing protein [Nocardiopsis coralli]|uniref:aromatic-ring hydroxylase C-terminal domain-containing protein n=1 Tax=Nocardiopsis coralli TaxID=2772213 RepID=UPI0038B2F163
MVPDLPVRTAAGPTSLCHLLAKGRPVLLAPPNGIEGPSERFVLTEAVASDPMTADGAAAVLVRPDGHAVWVRAESGRESGPLEEALARWCPRRRQGPRTAQPQ